MSQPIATNGYTRDEVLSVFYSRYCVRHFKTELCDWYGNVIRTLGGFIKATLTRNTQADIVSTYDITVKQSAAGSLNLLNQILRPSVGIQMPRIGDDETNMAWYPQGDFYTWGSPLEITENGVPLLQVKTRDKLYLLQDTQLGDYYTIAPGVLIVSAIETLLDTYMVASYDIEYNNATTNDTLIFNPEQTPLDVFKALLAKINYVYWADERNRIVAVAWDDPLSRPVDGELILTRTATGKSNTWSSKANVWIGRSAPDPKGQTFSDSVEDTDSTSSTSIPGRGGRRKIKYLNNLPVADSATLRKLLEREKASSPEDVFEIETPIEPWVGPRDIVGLTRSDVGASGPYEQVLVSYDFIHDSPMKRTLVKSLVSNLPVKNPIIQAALIGKRSAATQTQTNKIAIIDPAYVSGKPGVVFPETVVGDLADAPVTPPIEVSPDVPVNPGDTVLLIPTGPHTYAVGVRLKAAEA